HYQADLQLDLRVAAALAVSAVLQRGADQPEQLPRVAQGVQLRLLRFRAAQSAAQFRARRDGAGTGADGPVVSRRAACVALLSGRLFRETTASGRARVAAAGSRPAASSAASSAAPAAAYIG